MSGTNMDEDDYVETSDVEELAGLYGPFGLPDPSSSVHAGLMERQLTPVRTLTPQRVDDGRSGKRRKLNHPAHEETASPSRKPVGNIVNAHILTIGSQVRDNVGLGQNPDVGGGAKLKMEVDKRLGSQLPGYMDNDSVMRDVKAWASWTTPRKHTSPQEDNRLELSQRSIRKASHEELALEDYEGDLLNQFDQSLSPQAFSPKPTSTQGASRTDRGAYYMQEESEDELAAIPKSTSPLSTSQGASRTSEINLDGHETPLSFRSLSPLSPVESMHSHAEDKIIPVAQDRETATSPGTNATEAANTEDEAMSRYPLRRRQPNQLRPYLYDEYQYKTVLKHNPAAIIDVLRLHKRRMHQPEDRYEEDYVEEESQQQAVTQNEEIGAQMERPKSPVPPPPYDSVDPLSDSEDDSDTLAEEARRVDMNLKRREREERRKEKERQREEKEERRRERERLKAAREAQRRPKRFPMSNISTHSDKPGSRTYHNRASSTPRQIRHSPPAPRTQSSPLPQETNELDALRNHFMEDFTMTIGDVESNAAGPEPPPVAEAVELGDDSSSDQVNDSDNSSDSDSGKDSSTSVDKRYREIFKLYPPNMARELLKGKGQQRSRRHDMDSPVEEGPLLPGQSRARRAANPKDVRDIRGDSESDESDAEGRSVSPMPLYNGDIREYLDYDVPGDRDSQTNEAQEVGSTRPRSHSHSARHVPVTVPEIIEISDEGSSSSSEEEVVDEDDINTLLGDDDAGIVYDAGAGHGAVKEESMIDWMLSRTRIVGSTISKPKTAKRKRQVSRKIGPSRAGGSHASRSKFRIDVSTRDSRGFGNERQTRLSFANHTSTKNPNIRSGGPQAGLATEPIQVEIQGAEPDKRKGWKERRKERKERAKRQGVYSMANPHTTGVTSGKARKPIKVTIDINDDDFYQSFAPHSQSSGADHNVKDKIRLDAFHQPFNDSIDQRKPPVTTAEPRPRLKKRPRDLAAKCTVDMGIEFLQPGITFNPTSFLREGHLHALLDILTSDYIPPRPDPTYMCGVNINPSMDPDAFLQSIDRVFDGLLDLTLEIPSDGYEDKVRDWNNLTRSACRHITWLYLQSFGESRNRLSSFIKGKTLSTVTALKSKDIPPSALNITLLSLCWFCIEASFRSGYRLIDGSSDPPDLNPCYASVTLMLHYLVGYGLRKPYKAIKKKRVLDDAKMSCYTAQMWVCMLHLLSSCDSQLPDSPGKQTAFWSEILLHYQNLPSTNALETGEDIWRTIFALTALSQFSAFGIVVSNPRLSASWTLVAHAIKQVQLAQGANNLRHLARETLEKRDSYVYIVIARCYHLLDYWKWKMDHSFGTLNQLVDIFRARNFVNLHQEKADYPDFMLDGNWSLFSHLRPMADSGFTLILKLLMRAVDSNCLSKAEIKKMVALIIPVSKFRTQEKIPGVDDLSPICNRFAALTLAIAIDPTYATRIVNQVHGSIDFEASDSTTQILTIRGIKLLTSLMIQRNAPLQEVAKWLTAIIGKVATQFKALNLSRAVIQGRQTEHNDRTRNYSLLVLSLYATGRAIMETFATRAQYPDPAFLLAFKPFLEPECSKAIEEANCNLCEMRRFIESFLEARNQFLPLPPEPAPPTPQVDDPESQEYDFGIDFNDPTTLALLGDQGNNFMSIKEKESGGEFVHKVMFPCFWAAKRKIQRFCEAAADPAVDHDILRTLDSWARCLAGCMHILIQHRALPDWDWCLKEITPLWRTVRISWLKVRVKLVLYYEILRHDPAFYASNKSDFLELVFESFAIHDITIEPKFWRRIVLHECTSNVLFKDAAETLNLQGDGEYSNGREFRRALLRVLFRNIESRLQDTLDSGPQVELCLRLLSSIRSISQDFADKVQSSTEYHTWCKDMLALFENYPRLKHHQRLSFVLDLISRF